MATHQWGRYWGVSLYTVCHVKMYPQFMVFYFRNLMSGLMPKVQVNENVRLLSYVNTEAMISNRHGFCINSLVQLDSFSVQAQWDVLFTWLGPLIKTWIKCKYKINFVAYCTGKWQASPGHPQSGNKYKSSPSGLVQGIQSNLINVWKAAIFVSGFGAY